MSLYGEVPSDTASLAVESVYKNFFWHTEPADSIHKVLSTGGKIYSNLGIETIIFGSETIKFRLLNLGVVVKVPKRIHEWSEILNYQMEGMNLMFERRCPNYAPVSLVEIPNRFFKRHILTQYWIKGEFASQAQIDEVLARYRLSMYDSNVKGNGILNRRGLLIVVDFGCVREKISDQGI